jgi:SAM-dependent methyltransferase
MISDGSCKICLGEMEVVYTPKGSLISLNVVLCTSCGFVQTTKTETEAPLPNIIGSDFSSLSCDADYSPIRVGKQQMTNHDIKLISSRLERFENMSFLDMASARGHFASWAASVSNKTIVCIEPDSYMSESYRDNQGIKVYQCDYRDVQDLTAFDFVYSCHTLEHFSDPVRYLNFVHKHLNTGGFFYLNVPNLDGVRDSVNLDDFFYDRHRLYFDEESLLGLLVNSGFEVIADWHDSACLRFLVRRTEVPSVKVLVDRYQRNKSSLEEYVSSLAHNRSQLPNVVSSIIRELETDSTLVVVGCGRMLDALIKYGGFPISRVNYLIDNFIGQATDHLYNRTLYRFENFSAPETNLHFLVVARTSNVELMKEIGERFPDARVTFVSELI